VDVTVVVVSGPFVSESAIGTVLEGLASGDGNEDEGDGGRDESDPSDDLRDKTASVRDEKEGGTRRTDEVRNDRLLSRVSEVLAAGFDKGGDDSRVDAGSANHARLGRGVVLLERWKNGRKERERKREGRSQLRFLCSSAPPFSSPKTRLTLAGTRVAKKKTRMKMKTPSLIRIDLSVSA
jgi:hypothetical protein